MSKHFVAQGGKPITAELAIELRQLVFGTAGVPIRCEWAQTAFTFAAAREDRSYGLVSPRNGTRGLLSVLQGFILKNLLFKRTLLRSTGGSSVADSLRPNEEQQRNVLIRSMVEILTQISEMGKVTLALPGEETFIQHSITYFQDSITEKLYLFCVDTNGQLEVFLRQNINYFTDEDAPGALLFLYSAVLTRTFEKIRSDLDYRGSVPMSLVGNNNEEGSLNIVTLLLTGRATPYVHNGVVHVGDEDNYAIPKCGTLKRCSIGLLLWENDTNQAAIRVPGSRLKTPHLPIWISNCADRFGVLFNSNQDLLRNYHAESRFDLIYYCCSGHEISMTIDNRGLNESSRMSLERQSSESSSGTAPPPSDVKEESVNTPLQSLIHTKWQEANIHFHVQPSILRSLFSTTN